MTPVKRTRAPLAAAALLVALLACVLAQASGARARVAALDAGSVAISWPAVHGTAYVGIWRGGRLEDLVYGRRGGTYLDRGLWPQSRFRYVVAAIGRGGRTLRRWRVSAATPARSGSFPRLFADSSPFNVPIPPNPALDPASARMVAGAIQPYVGGANFTNSAEWGIPVFYANRRSRRYRVSCDRYCSAPVGFPRIPSDARASTGSDGHLAVLDPADGSELDMWLARRTPTGWVGGVRSLAELGGSGVHCRACGRPDAAGFALAAGIVRPEEIAQGHIDHALVITTPHTRGGLKACPAVGTDGDSGDSAALPLGARVQLDPGLNVDALGLPGWQKTIARALQTYGAYVVDTGGSLSIRAESNLGRGYDAWALAGVPDFPSISGLPWQLLRVLQIARC
ncbi:MAG: hypothetical protein M3155_08190 [Actinomycetota bacterium]|nr:hypothetical protein [Actinomycetota bacterium]